MSAFTLSLVDGCRLIDTPSGPALEQPFGRPLPLATLEAQSETADATAPTLDSETEATLREAVEKLSSGGATEEELSALASRRAGFHGIRRLYPLLFALHESRLLRRAVRHRGQLLFSGVPINDRCPFSAPAFDAERPQLLSRFALVRRIDEALCIESPLGLLRITLHGPKGTAMLGHLTQPRTAAELATLIEVDESTATEAFALLHLAALLTPMAEGDKGSVEDQDQALRQWQYHDLLFHSRSRLGTHSGGYGGTFRFRGQTAPLPALRPDFEGEVIDLPRPDLERLCDHDLPFTRVLEERHSHRRFGARPLGLDQLGELLFRAARVVRQDDGGEYGIAWRPYPGGGGAYELELYLVIDRCEGLEPGLYHYRPQAHQLVRLSERTPEIERLLDDAVHALRTTRPLQVLFQIAARFRRMSWKYESMTYATILKNVGVLYQTLYLVATALDLAVCAVGGGDSQTFARLAGTHPNDETTIGELVVGSRARDEG